MSEVTARPVGLSLKLTLPATRVAPLPVASAPVPGPHAAGKFLVLEAGHSRPRLKILRREAASTASAVHVTNLSGARRRQVIGENAGMTASPDSCLRIHRQALLPPPLDQARHRREKGCCGPSCAGCLGRKVAQFCEREAARQRNGRFTLCIAHCSRSRIGVISQRIREQF